MRPTRFRSELLILLCCLLAVPCIPHAQAEEGAPSVAGVPAVYSAAVGGYTQLIEQVKPWVVSVVPSRYEPEPLGHPWDWLAGAVGDEASRVLRQFVRYVFLEGETREMVQMQTYGSGVILSADGYIVTNEHVTRGADSIRAYLWDGRVFDAEIVGEDYVTDLAVIKIPAQGLEIAHISPKARVEVGDQVIAVGNALGLRNSVSMGIVSAVHRKVRDSDGRVHEGVMQTDAPINVGNSGGALVNLQGEVVGVVTFLVPDGEGVSFAIPSKRWKAVADALIREGRVREGTLGIEVESMELSPGQLRIARVESGSAAEAVGLKSGDIILGVQGVDLQSALEFRDWVRMAGIGKELQLNVRRGGVESWVRLRVEEVPTSIHTGVLAGQTAGGPKARLSLKEIGLLVVLILLGVLAASALRETLRKERRSGERRKGERRKGERRKGSDPLFDDEDRRRTERRAANRRNKHRR
ncbi:MAG: trypsin-like peptidase domain-containing protein [Candidatus Omnitrophica bacterium]|nr:trypsin-like peptidase domain-containing protein [Candidatus Omnitrophota bacterium]